MPDSTIPRLLRSFISQIEVEFEPSSFVLARSDMSAMVLHGVFYDGKAQSRAFRVRRALDPVKSLEYLLQLLSIYPFPGVVVAEMQLVVGFRISGDVYRKVLSCIS